MANYRECIGENHGLLSQDELTKKLSEEKWTNFTALAIFTDKVECFTWPSNVKPDYDHLLEIRLFNNKGEFHAVRGTIDKDFNWRYIKDANIDDDCILEEAHYLDIDSTKAAPTQGSYMTQGGGRFTLPIENANRIKIVNYIEYDEEGLAQIVDFRIFSLVCRGE